MFRKTDMAVHRKEVIGIIGQDTWDLIMDSVRSGRMSSQQIKDTAFCLGEQVGGKHKTRMDGGGKSDDAEMREILSDWYEVDIFSLEGTEDVKEKALEKLMSVFENKDINLQFLTFRLKTFLPSQLKKTNTKKEEGNMTFEPEVSKTAKQKRQSFSKRASFKRQTSRKDPDVELGLYNAALDESPNPTPEKENGRQYDEANNNESLGDKEPSLLTLFKVDKSVMLVDLDVTPNNDNESEHNSLLKDQEPSKQNVHLEKSCEAIMRRAMSEVRKQLGSTSISNERYEESERHGKGKWKDRFSKICRLPRRKRTMTALILGSLTVITVIALLAYIVGMHTTNPITNVPTNKQWVLVGGKDHLPSDQVVLLGHNCPSAPSTPSPLPIPLTGHFVAASPWGLMVGGGVGEGDHDSRTLLWNSTSLTWDQPDGLQLNQHRTYACVLKTNSDLEVTVLGGTAMEYPACVPSSETLVFSNLSLGWQLQEHSETLCDIATCYTNEPVMISC